MNVEGLALVALGSNVGDSITLVQTVAGLLEESSAGPLSRSSLWDTTPVDCPPGSPRFVNAAVALRPKRNETPESLLAKLQAIEQQFGRKPKTVLNEPRLLDLDLIAFGNEVRATPELMLPHPRAHLRKFVLQPLVEVAPEFILPGQTLTMAALLSRLRSTERVERIIAARL